MAEEASLDLDVVLEGRGERARTVARVCVANAFAFTRSGGGATITRDCGSLAAFEREVERLRRELDGILDRARAQLGAGPPAPAADTPGGGGAASASAPAPAHLDPSTPVRDAMTREVTTVGPNDPLALAEELMKQGRFRHLVVVDEGRVIGVVSQRDVFYGTLAWSMGLGRRAHERALDATPVKEVMHSDPATVDSGTPLAEAARLMTARKIGCLPVLEADRLVGILTEGDFLAMMLR